MADGRGSRYRFHSEWWVAAPPRAVHAVLARAGEYPRWWPQIRDATPTGPDTGICRFRSVLPLDLRVTVRSTRNDPAHGVLEAALGGDLDGWIRWTVIPGAGGTRVRYEQDTELRRPVLARLSWVVRPVLRANHALMMRSGRAGLRAAAGSWARDDSG